MGSLQQYKVAPAHQVEVVIEVRVGGRAAHLSPLLTGESYPETPPTPPIVSVCLDLQVAELGGTLGLFVGFSFLGFFYALVNISSSAINLFMRGRGQEVRK